MPSLTMDMNLEQDPVGMNTGMPGVHRATKWLDMTVRLNNKLGIAPKVKQNVEGVRNAKDQMGKIVSTIHSIVFSLW